MLKKPLSFILVLTIITCLNSDLTAFAATKSLSGKEIQTYVEGKVDSSYPKGYCLAFVADMFNELGAVRSSECCARKYALSHQTSTSSSNIPIGADVFFSGSSSTCSKCGNRCGHIGIYVGNGYVVHAMSGKVRKDLITTLDSYSNLTFTGWGIHGNISLTGSTEEIFKKDSSFLTPVTAYPAATSGKITLYNSNLTAYSTNSKYISYNDQCTINAFYTNGYCSVTYPSSVSSSGYNTEYAKTSDFIVNGVTPYSWAPSQDLPSYTRSNLSNSFGTVYPTDTCKVVGKSGSYLQVIYNVPGGYKMGWVNPSYAPSTPDAPETPRPSVNVPGPVAEGFLNGKTVVAMAPRKISFSSSSYISEGDVCKLYNFNTSTGYCTVDYPGGGKNDVFNTSTVRTQTVAISEFIAYNPNAQCEKAKIPNDLHVYPTSAMSDTVGSYTANWSLDAGDEYTTMNKGSGGQTEVLYYCTRGGHAGYWKLGWCWLDYYWLDLNGYLDNTLNGGLGSYGTADVYINGILRANDVNDFYSTNGTYPRGSTYSIQDIKPYNGYNYNNVYSGSLSGTLTGNTSVALNFTKKPVTCSALSVASNPSKTTYLEGENLNTGGLKVVATFSDGSTKDVTSSCSFSGYSSSPGAKTVTVSYSGKTTAFSVMVNRKSPTEITVISKPNKTSYYINDTVDLTGLAVKATYNNGTSATITDYDVFTDGITSSSGSKTVNIMYVYNDVVKTTSFTITVNPNTYTISYNANGGTGAPAAQTKRYQENISLSDTKPIRSGYSFVGWATSSSATTAAYQPGSTFTLNANTTLYAVWKAIPVYTITYDANGGSGAPSPQYVNEGSSVIISSVKPTRNGYTFLGWATASNASSATYTSGQVIYPSYSMTLYAVWQKTRVPGDVNNDGKVTTMDATLIKRKIVGGFSIPVFNEANADVNGDGKVTTMDATLIKRYIVGGYGVVLK